MKRCKCLRYKELQYLNRDSRIWIFDKKLGLIPLSVKYPLIEFDRGNAIMVCPFLLYIGDDVRISSAYFRKNLTKNELTIIKEAVETCNNKVPLQKYLEDRHAQVLELYARKNGIIIDERIFDIFHEFIKKRKKYLDVSACLSIPLANHDERMECLNQAWLDAFNAYLEENGIDVS